MARFYGAIGFAITQETRPGIYEERYIERFYKGTITRHSTRWGSSEYLNDNLEINNDISIVADTFANEHFGVMRYVRWNKQVFGISSATIDTDLHRINLSLGGVFNVPDTDEESEVGTP